MDADEDPGACANGASMDGEVPDGVTRPRGRVRLTRASWERALRSTVREYKQDGAADIAAGLTFWAVLAIPPAVLALVSLLSIFGDPTAIVERATDAVVRLMPDADPATVSDAVGNLVSQERAGVAFAGGLVLALWSSSGYVSAFSRAMNRVWEVEEGRPIWKLRPAMFAVTAAILAGGAVICGALVLSGPVAESVGEVFGVPGATVRVWRVVRWLVVAVLITMVVAVLQWATPNVRRPFRILSIGAAAAIGVWALAAAGFGWYVSHLGDYGRTYGALAGLVLFLLWLWLTNNALLLGAELDSELERSRELQAGMNAVDRIQLPARDVRGVERMAERTRRARERSVELLATGGRSIYAGGQRARVRMPWRRTGAG